jgi:hypothetical protein
LHPFLLVHVCASVHDNNTDAVESGVTATIVIGEQLGEDLVQDQGTLPSLDDVTPQNSNQLHFRNVSRFHLYKVLCRLHDGYESYSMEAPALEPLAVRKTVTFPLPSMEIDQATVDGNIRIITKIMIDILGLPKDWFDRDIMIVIAGDWLTVTRIRSMQALLTQNTTKFDRMRWTIPVFQLFHLKMQVCSAILRIHYGHVTTPGSLAYFITKLGRKRLSSTKPCFATADEFLRHVYDAFVRRLWQVELGVQKLDTLEEGVFKRCPNDQVRTILAQTADAIRARYFGALKDLRERLGNTNLNAALFLRDMTTYIELCAAIKNGDIKRIEEVFVTITLMFQATERKNYANELLRFNYGINHLWSAQRKNAIFSSLLVNVKGKENSWIPTDLYQEQNNMLTKAIHSAKGSNMSWETLANNISTNVRLFKSIASKLESEFCIPYNSTFHTVVSAEIDIRTIMNSLEEHNILGRDPRLDDRDTSVVKDMVREGYIKLVGGRFDHFIQNMCTMDVDYDSDDDGHDETLVDGLQLENHEAEEYIESCFE